MSTERTYKSLDAWRGIAALSVVVYHASIGTLESFVNDPQLSTWQQLITRLLCHGDFGVIIFFVISGYCITSAAVNAHVAHSQGNVTRYNAPCAFLGRRLRRIYPPFWAALLLTCLVDMLQMHFTGRSAGAIDALRVTNLQQIVGNVLLVEDARPLFNDHPSILVAPISWSLCYEVQFYFIVGLLMLWPARMYRNLFMITALVLVLHLVQLASGIFPLNRTFLDGTWLYFAVGILVHYALHRSPWSPSRWQCVLGLVVFLLFAAFLLGIKSQILPLLIVSFAFGTVLLTLYGDDAVLIRRPGLPRLMALGRYSYSLYLTHAIFTWLVAEVLFAELKTSWYGTIFVSLPLSAVVCLLVAKGFFVVVERKCISRERSKLLVADLPMKASSYPKGDSLRNTTS